MPAVADVRRKLRPARQALREFTNAAVRRNARDDRALDLAIVFGLREDANCIDVGAHAGSVLRTIMRAAPRGQHIAYEPLPTFAQALRVEFPAVDVREAAVSEHPGRTTFIHVEDAPAYSGIRERDYDRDVTKRVIEVEVQALDASLPAGFRPDFIKIDVEGGELGVLRGARTILSTHQPMVAFECGKRAALAGYGTLPEEVYTELVDRSGLRIFDMDGSGPYSMDRFVDSFYSGGRWNYLAHL